MTETELKAAIKSGLTGGYLLFGDEDYLKKFYLTKMRESVLADCPPGLLDFNLISLTLEDGDFSKLENAIAAPPVMAPRKFVEVIPPNAAAWKEKERRLIGEILKDLEGMPDTVLCMLCPKDTLEAGTAKKPNATYKALTASLKPVQVSLQTGEKLRRWAMRHFAEENIGIPDAVCAFLLSRCAPDMMTLTKEIDKVICYVKAHGRDNVTKEDVEFVTSQCIREDAFGLANAVLAGDRTAALYALDVYKKRKEAPSVILYSLSAVMSDLLTVATLADGGADKAEIVRLTRMHEYKAGIYMRAAADFGTPRIAAALSRCLKADRLLKSMDLGYIPLERFVSTIPLGAGKGKKHG